MKLQPFELGNLKSLTTMVGVLQTIPALKAQLDSEQGKTEFDQFKNSLTELENELIYIDKAELRKAKEDIQPWVQLGILFAETSRNDPDFLPWMESFIGKEALPKLVEIMKIAYEVDQKIHIILTEPDPDEDSPEFHQFLIDLAIQAESEGPPSKASFSARESLGL